MPNPNDKSIPELDLARSGAPDTDFIGVAWDTVLRKTVKRPGGAASIVSSSSIRGGTKFVRYLSSAYLGVVAGDSTLDRVNVDTLVVGNEALVYNPSASPLSSSQMSRGYVLARVAVGTAGAIMAYVDDNPATTTRVPCTWVEKGTAAGDAASVEPFDIDRDVYPNGSNVKLVINGSLGIFAARKVLRAVDFVTGKIPAPTGLVSDINWTSTPGVVTHQQNTDTGTNRRLFTIGLGVNSRQEPGANSRSVLGFGTADNAPAAALAYNWGDTGAPRFETTDNYTGTAADTWVPLGSGGGGSAPLTGQYLDIRSIAGLRVFEFLVPAPLVIDSELIDYNATGVRYQLDINTRVGTRIYGSPNQTKAQVQTQLNALVAGDYANGVRLYIATTPFSSVDPSLITIKITSTAVVLTSGTSLSKFPEDSSQAPGILINPYFFDPFTGDENTGWQVAGGWNRDPLNALAICTQGSYLYQKATGMVPGAAYRVFISSVPRPDGIASSGDLYFTATNSQNQPVYVGSGLGDFTYDFIATIGTERIHIVGGGATMPGTYFTGALSHFDIKRI